MKLNANQKVQVTSRSARNLTFDVRQERWDLMQHETAESHCKTGDSLLKRGEFAEALSNFEEALSVARGSYERSICFYNIAICHSRLRQLPACLTALTQAASASNAVIANIHRSTDFPEVCNTSGYRALLTAYPLPFWRAGGKTPHNSESSACPHCGKEYSPEDYDAHADEWQCSTCKSPLPRQSIPPADVPQLSNERIRLFCNAQREPCATRLHMPAIVMGLLMGMIKLSFITGIAVLFGVEVLIAIVNAVCDQMFAFRRVPRRLYSIHPVAHAINGQLADVQDGKVFLRVTADEQGLTGNIVSFSKNDFCDADLEYINSIVERVNESQLGQTRTPADSPVARTPEDHEKEKSAQTVARQEETRRKEEGRLDREQKRLSQIAATLLPSERMCPDCGVKYKPTDYNPNAPEWLCSACKAVLPR